VDEIIPPFDPYLYQGTLDNWDDEALRKTFAQAPFIEVSKKFCSPDSPIPVQGLTVSSINGVHLRTPISAPIPFFEDIRFKESWNLKVTKVGILLRKGKS
jgi:hypothetical protein